VRVAIGIHGAKQRIARRETYGVSRSGNGCAESAPLKLRQATLYRGAHRSRTQRTNIAVLCRSEKVIVKCVSLVAITFVSCCKASSASELCDIFREQKAVLALGAQECSLCRRDQICINYLVSCVRLMNYFADAAQIYCISCLRFRLNTLRDNNLALWYKLTKDERVTSGKMSQMPFVNLI
jgi:hypothetical protein